jgi:hypothetical protein
MLPNTDAVSYSACQIGPTLSFWFSDERGWLGLWRFCASLDCCACFCSVLLQILVEHFGTSAVYLAFVAHVTGHTGRNPVCVSVGTSVCNSIHVQCHAGSRLVHHELEGAVGRTAADVSRLHRLRCFDPSARIDRHIQKGTGRADTLKRSTVPRWNFQPKPMQWWAEAQGLGSRD